MQDGHVSALRTPTLAAWGPVRTPVRTPTYPSRVERVDGVWYAFYQRLYESMWWRSGVGWCSGGEHAGANGLR
jgi:hypothetical protein